MMDGWLILQQSSGSSDKDKPMMKTYDERMEGFLLATEISVEGTRFIRVS